METECLETTSLINFEDPCYGAEWIIVPNKVIDVAHKIAHLAFVSMVLMMLVVPDFLNLIQFWYIPLIIMFKLCSCDFFY